MGGRRACAPDDAQTDHQRSESDAVHDVLSFWCWSQRPTGVGVGRAMLRSNDRAFGGARASSNRYASQMRALHTHLASGQERTIQLFTRFGAQRPLLVARNLHQERDLL